MQLVRTARSTAPGLHEEGLYRIPGDKTAFMALAESMNRIIDPRRTVDLSVRAVPDVNTITTCVKFYFQQLPEPLIPTGFVADLVSVTGMCAWLRQRAVRLTVMPTRVRLLAGTEQRDRRSYLNSIRGIIVQFPPAHYDLLKLMLRHLSRVASRSNRNKMTARNLAIVLLPSLIPLQNSMVDSNITRPLFLVLQKLIDDYEEIFDDSLATALILQRP